MAQELQLRSVIVGKNTKQLSPPFGVWNRRAVMQTIKVLANYGGSKRWVFK